MRKFDDGFEIIEDEVRSAEVEVATVGYTTPNMRIVLRVYMFESDRCRSHVSRRIVRCRVS